MKKYSLVTLELLRAYIAIAQILIGIAGLIFRTSLVTAILLSLILVSTIVISIFLKTKHFDTWDETAQEHYATAQRITLDAIFYAATLSGFVFFIFRLSVSIELFHILILSGIIYLMQSIIFIILEKREV